MVRCDWGSLSEVWWPAGGDGGLSEMLVVVGGLYIDVWWLVVVYYGWWLLVAAVVVVDRNGLKVLEQRSLITVDEYGSLGMHDHIEEMRKNIVRREHTDEPNKHSHLWTDEEIEDILANDMGAEETRCLKHNMPLANKRFLGKGLGKMKKLRYLEVFFYEFCMSVTCHKLKHLFITFSKLRTFDLGLTPNLERLSLDNSADFEELHVSFACPNLKFLDLSFSSLRSLDLELIPNLKSLFVLYEDKTSSKEHLMLKHLKSLKVNYVYPSEVPEDLLEKVPEDLGQLEWLESLIVRSKKIEFLPDSICMLKRLKELVVANCCRLGKLSEEIGQLESLETLGVRRVVCGIMYGVGSGIGLEALGDVGLVRSIHEELIGVMQNIVVDYNCRDKWRWTLGEDGEFAVKELTRLIDEKVLCVESDGD
ncbi:Toll/interleukin-1 receptor domain-containing protein [Tanacetum coccineum]